MNEYNRFSKGVKASDELKERTMKAVQAEIKSEMLGRKPKKKTWNAWQRMLAAACAFGILIGGGTLWQKRQASKTGEENANPVTDIIENTFGIVAYAADTGETSKPQNSHLIFEAANGGQDGHTGMFTGSLFKIQGQNIKSFSVKMDNNRAGIYRQDRIEVNDQATADAVKKASDMGVEPFGADGMFGFEGDLEDPMTWSFDLVNYIGNDFTEEYEPDAAYGFWVAPAETMDEEKEVRDAWQEHVDELNGVIMEIVVTFENGETKSQRMRLKTGKLALYGEGEPNEGQPTGEFTEVYGEPYAYGVLADIL